MWTKKILLIILVIETKNAVTQGIVGNPLLQAHPCTDNDKITLSFEPNLPPEEENQYHVYISIPISSHSKVYLKFDSEATVRLFDPSVARITPENAQFRIHFFKNADNLNFNVRGPVNGTIPYLTSVNINGVENCKNYTTGFLDYLISGYQDTAEVHLTVPDASCGRRKIQYTELITNGLETKPGDWPWHVALYRLENADIKYICGGTLMSKTFVITAAHCTTIRGSPVLPETLSVVLGKYNLIGGDISRQEKEVHEVIVHEEFTAKNLDNDISLLKLKTEVQFNDYIQPACLWFGDLQKKLPKGDIYGTVVGWGFDHTDRLSSQLRQATMPKVSESTCIKSNPVFFGKVLNNRKFCAGTLNGTSACNGDSGGGFTVFVPDSTSSNTDGAWYIRGIVSLSLSRKDIALCDPSSYVVFTDVAKYRGWVKKYVK
ncbi:chymotrypsin-C-like [Pectinophora gossypiella]|uniref:chymotrypsin-C-like n=1 Tax=Pectinophora gossypiella TaxID=13191 RepID=UPI00214E192C|nr:chymotrypsin-C-like [Pectinophora gossypiella]